MSQHHEPVPKNLSYEDCENRGSLASPPDDRVSFALQCFGNFFTRGNRAKEVPPTEEIEAAISCILNGVHETRVKMHQHDESAPETLSPEDSKLWDWATAIIMNPSAGEAVKQTALSIRIKLAERAMTARRSKRPSPASHDFLDKGRFIQCRQSPGKS